MANRIVLRVLGATLSPYSSSTPILANGAISEDISFDVSQLQGGHDTTAAQRTAFPNALSVISVKYVLANHFKSENIYVTLDSAGVNTAANA